MLGLLFKQFTARWLKLPNWTQHLLGWPLLLGGIWLFIRLLGLISDGYFALFKWAVVLPACRLFELDSADQKTQTWISLGFLAALIFGSVAAIFSTCRFRPIRCFVSFQHLQADKLELVQAGLARHGVKPLILPFSKDHRHDDVLDIVRDNLQKSDVLVAIPAPDRASFVNAELLAAAVSNQPVMLIQYQEDQINPATFFTGFPVFDYEKLRARDFRPLALFVQLSARHFRTTARYFWMNYQWAIHAAVLTLGVVILLTFFNSGLLGWISVANQAISDLFGSSRNWIGSDYLRFEKLQERQTTAHFVVFLMLAVFQISFKNFMAELRQNKLTGAKSIHRFREFLKPEEDGKTDDEFGQIIECLRENTLVQRH